MTDLKNFSPLANVSTLSGAVRFFLALLCLNTAVAAQYRFDVWTTENGLPQNSVTSILQTKDGYLWLTTNDGLVRYDGVRFKVFNTGNTNGIKGIRFHNLFEEPNGTLWIMSEYNGLLKYQNGVFTTYTTRDGLPSNVVDVVKNDSDGKVIVRTQSGWAKFENERFSLMETPPDNAPLIPPPFWFIDSNGLHQIVDEQINSTVPLNGNYAAEVEEILGKKFGFVITDKNKTKRFLNSDGSAKFDYATGSYVTSQVKDRQGNIWFDSGGAGLFRLNQGKIYNYTTENGLPSDIVHTVYEDREGNIWVGTAQGLCRITERLIQSYSKADGLANNNVYPILEDSRGRIWIGSWTGLTKYENGRFADVSEQFNLKGDLVRSIYEDREGNLWIGTFGGGVRKMTRSNQLTTYHFGTFLQEEIVHSIYQDRQGAMWFGTQTGLIKFENNQIVKFTQKNGLSGDVINIIFEDSKGSLWFGTELGITELKDGTFTVYDEEEGLSGVIVRSIYEDVEGVLWFGTYDGGLNRLKNGKFTKYTTNEGLFNNGVFQILEDERGDFWMSCNLGIYRVSRRELNDFADGRITQITSVSYGKPDGMLNSECNGGGQPAGIKAKDGKLWFPTLAGVSIIEPQRITVNQTPPPIFLEEIHVDNKTITVGDKLEIPPDKDTFEISYTGLSFILSEQIRFRYRLEGLDADWIDAGTRRTAYYSYLPPGTYNFMVTAANRDGVWNPNPAQIKIVVVPRLWQTAWFRALLVLFIVGLLIFFYTRRIFALERANETQKAFSRQLIESQEQERKRIAAELHDSLSQNLVVIKNRLLLAIRFVENKEKMLAQLSEIASATDEAIDEVSEISYNLRPYQLDKLGLKKAVESLLKKISTASGIKFTSEIDNLGEVFSPDAEINIYRVIQECTNNIVKHSGATEAEVKIIKSENRVSLVISDNGRGFVPEQITTTHKKGGFGLIGIAERARIIGGKYQVQSLPGGGTTVSLEISLPQAKFN